MDNMSTWDVEEWSVATKCVSRVGNGSVNTVDVFEVFKSLETLEWCWQSLAKCSSLQIRHGERGFLAEVEESNDFSRGEFSCFFLFFPFFLPHVCFWLLPLLDDNTLISEARVFYDALVVLLVMARVWLDGLPAVCMLEEPITPSSSWESLLDCGGGGTVKDDQGALGIFL